MASSTTTESYAGHGISHLTLHAAGLNAHSQLNADHDRDVRTYQRIHTDEDQDIDILFTGWSTTVLASHHKIWSLGHQQLTATVPAQPQSAIGDHNGLLGFLDEHGALIYVTETIPSQAARLEVPTTDSSPRLSLIALASNDRITVSFKQAPNGRLCHVAEFATFQKFLTWYRDPSGENNYPDKHHMLPGRPKQLVANTASFLLLMEDGEVYSWGDPRHQSLGRLISGKDATPADVPGVVDALGGLRIKRVANGGWLSAALSEDGALYLWGAGRPGGDSSIRTLREAGAGEVVLVELPDDDGEPLDVIDVAVGDAHVAAVTADHRLFVVGENKNGQLGLGSDEAFVEDWQPVDRMEAVQRVVCGSHATIALVAAP